MDFRKILSDNKADFLELWFNTIIESYPKGSGKFFSDRKDRFANPVGFAIFTELSKLFDAIDSNEDDEIGKAFDNILRIRAVQDLTPSQALDFVVQYKNIAERFLSRSNIEFIVYNELYTTTVNLLLKGFDIFVGLKEQLFEIKANEVKNRFSKAIDRLNKKYDTEDI